MIDSFLPSRTLLAGLAEIVETDHQFEIEARGTGRIEFSLLKSETLWRAIYSRRIVDLLSVAFGVRVRLNRHNLLQLRRMNDETPDFPLHSDHTGDEETIVAFLYLSDGWAPDRGGRLRLHCGKDRPTPSVCIDPIQNRFVAFQTSAAHWHSVERTHGWDRLSVLALWDIEKSADG